VSNISTILERREFVMSANEEEFRMKYIFCYITKATFLKELYLKTNLIKKYNKLNETIEYSINRP
jgi:hypothetical protein